ncbi:CPK1 [Symbiodinium sp. CCMP2592]|nr:CPK1 [Symbiodinium sp. CCMP2592]
MLKILVRLLLSGQLFGQAARLDSHREEQAVGSESMMRGEALANVHRYRALDESEFQRFRAGENVSLIATSFSEDEEDPVLPQEWSEKLSVVKKLGQGAFGKVYQCKVLCEKYKEVYVSVKLIVKKSTMVRQEIKVLEDMRGVSEFCISAVGEPAFIDNEAGYWIMMPYMNGGELSDFLKKCDSDTRGCNSWGSREGRKDWTKLNPAWTTPYILGLFHDMVQGVQALHDKAGLLHLDLKPANAMLNCQGSACFAAIIDLGLACDPKKPRDCGASGTPLYLPREVYLYERDGLESAARDVWALGLILYELLYIHYPPWFYRSSKTIEQQILDYDVEKDANVPRTQNVDSLVREMLHKDWKKRPSLRQIRTKVSELVYRHTPVDTQAVGMVKWSPAERHASVATPTCLNKKEINLAPHPPPGGRPIYIPGHEEIKTTTTTTVYWRQNLRQERAAEQLEKAQRERAEAEAAAKQAQHQRDQDVAAAKEARRQRDEAVAAAAEAQRQHEQWVAATNKARAAAKEAQRQHEQWQATLKQDQVAHESWAAAAKEAQSQHEQEVAATKEAQRQREEAVAAANEAKRQQEQFVAAAKEAQRQHENLLAIVKQDQVAHESWVAAAKEAQRQHEQEVAATKEAQRQREEAAAAAKEAQQRLEEAVAAAKEELEKRKHGRKHHDAVDEDRVQRRRRRPDAEPTDEAPTTTTTTTARRSHHDAVDEERVHRRRRRPDAEPTPPAPTTTTTTRHSHHDADRRRRRPDPEPTHAVDEERVHRRRRPSEPEPTDAVDEEPAQRRRRRPE